MAKTLLQEIAARVAKNEKITIKAAEAFVSNFFAVIREGLEADKQVKVRGLGTFKIIPVKDRESINVNTGERVLIAGHDKISFTPDAGMKELVNRPFSQFDTVELEDGVDFEDVPHGPEEKETEEPALEATVAPLMASVDEKEEKIEETVEKIKDQILTAEEPKVEEEPQVEEPKVEEELEVEETKVEQHETEEPEVEEPQQVEEPEAEEEPEVKEEPEVEEPSDSSSKKSNVWVKVLCGVAILALCCLIGWWFSQRGAGNDVEEPEPVAVADSTANDTIATEEVAAPKDGLDLEKINKDPRISQGAYRIVGVENEVTLREGQTMESYCVRTLGGIAMLPYCQALNDTTEMGAGDTMKVPKLELKSKSK